MFIHSSRSRTLCLVFVVLLMSGLPYYFRTRRPSFAVPVNASLADPMALTPEQTLQSLAQLAASATALTANTSALTASCNSNAEAIAALSTEVLAIADRQHKSSADQLTRLTDLAVENNASHLALAANISAFHTQLQDLATSTHAALAALATKVNTGSSIPKLRKYDGLARQRHNWMSQSLAALEQWQPGCTVLLTDVSKTFDADAVTQELHLDGDGNRVVVITAENRKTATAMYRAIAAAVSDDARALVQAAELKWAAADTGLAYVVWESLRLTDTSSVR
jgi:DNA-binding cell septation regulator SpoVG